MAVQALTNRRESGGWGWLDLLAVCAPPPTPPHGGGGEALEDGWRGSGSGDDGAGPERHSQYAESGGLQGGFEAVGEEDAALVVRINPKVGALSGIGANSNDIFLRNAWTPMT